MQHAADVQHVVERIFVQFPDKNIYHRKYHDVAINSYSYILIVILYLLFCPDHVEDVQGWLSPKVYQVLSIAFIVVLVLGLIAVLGGFAFVKHQEKSKKRFF